MKKSLLIVIFYAFIVKASEDIQSPAVNNMTNYTINIYYIPGKSRYLVAVPGKTLKPEEQNFILARSNNEFGKFIMFYAELIIKKDDAMHHITSKLMNIENDKIYNIISTQDNGIEIVEAN
ncbi:MAG: hypothetical protein P4L22_06530 [Candidatus Babeliales bacterium]|nr:hypothetical protein [Candidatus Babeliales bacterium]